VFLALLLFAFRAVWCLVHIYGIAIWNYAGDGSYTSVQDIHPVGIVAPVPVNECERYASIEVHHVKKKKWRCQHVNMSKN
jgi:hypothetical protein